MKPTILSDEEQSGNITPAGYYVAKGFFDSVEIELLKRSARRTA